jgi:hypothetical protein
MSAESRNNLIRRDSVLRYGIINSDATMEQFMSRHATNGSTAGNGVLCGSAPIAKSCNNITTVGIGISSRASPEIMQYDSRAGKLKHSSITF